MSRIIIVDENDNPIGVKEREEVGPGDVYRCSAVWITNSKKQTLLQQRAFSKKVQPGKWGTAAAGAIDEGEDYEINAVKETAEELGIVIDARQLTVGPKRLVHVQGHSFFCQWYLYVTDTPLEEMRLQDEEVATARWFEPDELQKMLQEHPDQFFGNSPEWFKEIMQSTNVLNAPSK